MKKFHKAQFISLLFLYFFILPIFIYSNYINLQIGREETKAEIPPKVSSFLPPKPPNVKLNFLDDFNYNTTHPNWTVVKKNGDIRVSYPYLNITTFAGSNQDWWTNLYYAPYCYVTLPSGDFIITTKLLNPENLPDSSHVGLLLYENDQNAYFYGRKRTGSENGVRIEGLRANSGQRLVYDYDGTITIQYYRITRKGIMYNFEFSPDGVRWVSLVNYTATNLGFTPHYGGLVNKKWGSTGFSAYFEYFYLYDNHLEVAQQTKAGFYNATWNFENDQVGSIPAGWNTFNSPMEGTVTLVENWYGHNHVLEVNDTGSTAGVGAYRMLGATISSGFIEYWVYLKSNANCGVVDGCFGNASDFTSCGFRLHRANGRWYASEVDTGVSAAVSIWHRIQISFGPTGITFTVDGTIVATRTWLNGHTSIDRISIASGSSAIAYEAYYDAFGLSWEGYAALTNKYDTLTPTNWSYCLGTTGNSIKWSITDILAPTPTYSILRDDTLQQSGAWVSGIPIEYNVDGLNLGVYNFTISAVDGAGEFASNQVFITVVANQAPNITPRADIEFENCSINRNIFWTIYDAFTLSPSYVVKKDDIDFTSGTWTSGSPVTINVDSFNIGQFNLTLIAVDGLSLSAQDEINVTIALNLPPHLTSPPDQIIEVVTNIAWINWNITDCNISTGTYTVYCNESLNGTGTWLSGNQVAVNLTGLGIGRYNFTLVVNDGWGGTSQDEVWVEVRWEAVEGYALVIGINDYPGTDNDLTCCVADTDGMYDMLANVDFLPENMIRLTDSQATEPAIVAAINQIGTRIDANDIFVFQYSGHGSYSFRTTGGTYGCSIHTPHPYYANMDTTYSIHHEGAKAIRVLFQSFNTEYNYDGAIVYNDIGEAALYMGNMGTFWSTWLSGDSFYVEFISDYSYQYYGFDILTYEIATELNGEIVTYDFSTNGGMWGNELDAALDTLPCQNQFIFLDSCFSGGLIFDMAQSGRAIMTACSDSEVSLEDSDNGHGAFSNFLLQVFDKTGNEYTYDTNHDGNVSIVEMFAFVGPSTISRTGELGYAHHPQLSNNAVTGVWDFDADNDDLSDYEEIMMYGTNPENNDTDGDSLSDGFEVINDLNPLEANLIDDADSDGLNTSEESLYHTDPANPDSDGDGLSDGDEVDLYGTSPLLVDSDNDGMPDLWEVTNSFNPLVNDAAGDPDGDGLLNLNEYQIGADPYDGDTDGDSLPDGWEYNYNLNPTEPNDPEADPDGDGLTDLQESQLGTNPFSIDTEKDGMPDSWEVEQSFNPLVNDANLDADNDGLNNLGECQHGADPHDSDTDNDLMLDGYEHTYGLNILVNDASGDLDSDGLTNYQESQFGTNPTYSDSDYDSMPDGWEVSYTLNPLFNDASADADGDMLANKDEYQHGANPRDTDTDNDGMSDGYEHTYSFNILVNDAGADADNDNFTNLEEYLRGTNPKDSDSDDDGLKDGVEVKQYGSNPLKTDTDDDGLTDNAEVSTHHTDPTKADTDGDALTDKEEIQTYRTSPTKSDTDGDRLSDGQEVKTHHTDPLRRDTDNDIWYDGDEIDWGTNPLDRNSNPGGYVALIVFGIIGVLIAGAVVYRKRHPSSFRSSPSRWNSASSPSWQNKHSSSDYYPPPRPTRPPSYSPSPPRNQGGYGYGREPSYNGMTAYQWEIVAMRALADHRPDLAAQAYMIAQKLRELAGPKPSSSPSSRPSSYGQPPVSEQIPTIAEQVTEKFRTAASQYKIGSYDEARKNLRQVVKLDPSHAGAWHLLGLILRAQHEDVGAEQAFQNSLNRNPQNPDAWVSLAEVYADTGRVKDATDAANHAIDVAPRAWGGQARVEVLLNKLAAKQQTPQTAHGLRVSIPNPTPVEPEQEPEVESQKDVDESSLDTIPPTVEPPVGDAAPSTPREDVEELSTESSIPPQVPDIAPPEEVPASITKDAGKVAESPADIPPETLEPIPPHVPDIPPPEEVPASIAKDAGKVAEIPGDIPPETLEPIPPTPKAPEDVIQKCEFCSNLVQGGECISCGAKVCPHCGETNFANAHTCVNCRKDL